MVNGTLSCSHIWTKAENRCENGLFVPYRVDSASLKTILPTGSLSTFAFISSESANSSL